MRRFRYAFDPLCVLAILAYALNRWVVSPRLDWPFLSGSFADLLLIPAALPPVLWVQRRLGLRAHGRFPTALEIVGHWLVWSTICEGLGPLFFPRAVADWKDVAAYAVGGLLSWIVWNRGILTSGFDLLASHYDWMENVLAGKKLIRCRRAHLTDLPVCQNVLLVGEGPGRFLVELVRRQPSARITCVDASFCMLDLARARLRRTDHAMDRVIFLQKNVLKWRPPTNAYDLIVTNFVLDCFTGAQLATLIPRLAAAAKPEALWLVADFQIPATGFLRRLRAAAIHWTMYRFFRLATQLSAAALEPPAPYLVAQGFVCRRRCESEWGLLYSEAWKKTLLPISDPSSGEI